MNKKTIGLALCALLLALSISPQAQQQAQVPKIGWLGARSAASGAGLERLRQELRVLGYVEGKNIVFESRYADNKLERLPALADELVRIKVDVLVAAQTPEATAAKNASRTIPIVFVIAGDPVAAGLIDSLARPGGNITGFTIISGVLAGKRLELLKETIPKLSRVAVFWNPNDPGSTQQWKESQLAAKGLGLQLHSMEVSRADKIESAFKEAVEAHSRGLAVTSTPLTGRKRIAELAAKNRLPIIHNQADAVDDGGLMSYGSLS